jgi:hypothetical protein
MESRLLLIAAPGQVGRSLFPPKIERHLLWKKENVLNVVLSIGQRQLFANAVVSDSTSGMRQLAKSEIYLNRDVQLQEQILLAQTKLPVQMSIVKVGKK